MIGMEASYLFASLSSPIATRERFGPPTQRENKHPPPRGVLRLPRTARQFQAEAWEPHNDSSVTD